MKIFTSGTRLSKGACALAVAGAVALPLAPVLAENINIAAQNVAAQNVAAGDQVSAGASFGLSLIHISLSPRSPGVRSRCEAPPVTDMREPLFCAYFRPLGAGVTRRFITLTHENR